VLRQNVTRKRRKCAAFCKRVVVIRPHAIRLIDTNGNPRGKLQVLSCIDRCTQHIAGEPRLSRLPAAALHSL
jgi:hypothetical protein